MEQLKQGSALVVTLLIMSVITILGTTLLYTTTLVHDFALQRISCIQQYHALRSLLYYGISECKNIDNKYSLVTFNESITKTDNYTLTPWLHPKLGYSATLTIKSQASLFLIEANLFKNGTLSYQGTCQLAKKNKIWNILSIDWKQAQ